MKRFSRFLMYSALFLALVSCGKKKESNIIIVRKPEAAKPVVTQKMGDYARSQVVQWLGAPYKISVKFSADPSLPTVMDGEQRYYDNQVTLVITRADGTEFYRKTFTKADFGSYLTADYQKDGALLGVVFERVDHDRLNFAVSVGSPDKVSDDYIPLLMKLDRTGGLTIVKDTRSDVGDVSSESDVEE